MKFENRINDDYFEWLCGLVNARRFAKQNSYRKLLIRLHNTEFTWFIPYDDNRADDGIQLRRKYAMDHGDLTLQNYIQGPCSIFEMMVALSIRCENIMDDALMGDRTGQWFWSMVHSLGLSPMRDSDFDKNVVDDILARFLNREYEPNGRGGLFTIRHCAADLRSVEIWRQLTWYLDSIT